MKWIDIKDELPDYDVYVLWYMDSGFMFIDDIDHDNDWQNFKQSHESFMMGSEISDDKITHWMPLPKAPNNQ